VGYLLSGSTGNPLLIEQATETLGMTDGSAESGIEKELQRNNLQGT
jgi:hypothetical protein